MSYQTEFFVENIHLSRQFDILGGETPMPAGTLFEYAHFLLRDLLSNLSPKLDLSKIKALTVAPIVCDTKSLEKAIADNFDGSSLEIRTDGITVCRILANGDHKIKDAAVNILKTRRELREHSEKMRVAILEELLDGGVDIPCFDCIEISPFASIGNGTLILTGTKIYANCKIGGNCKIGPNTQIEDASVGNGCELNNTKIVSSVIEDEVKIGPYCNIRPNCLIKRGVKIGDFVEVKNSIIGEDTHASHLTYIGDSDVGARVNFGCGTVTSNYDGVNKYRTVIEDDAFIGCNTNLVAPVTVGKGAYTAAGSTITSDVPPDSLALARSRQTVKDGWAKKKRQDK